MIVISMGIKELAAGVAQRLRLLAQHMELSKKNLLVGKKNYARSSDYLKLEITRCLFLEWVALGRVLLYVNTLN